MDLGDWNQRLAEHFSALARDRKDIPLFALEHGLTPDEVLALSEKLRSRILVSPPSSRHALVWTVYATEIGYGYAGDEYWQTFEAKTPAWRENGNRDWIRDAFVAFQRRFAAAKPSGPWAAQFSIIAWPITHAILPRDLQQQLARILYEVRHSFSAELFDEPQRLGDFIAARSWRTSARFQNLVQAPALVGQIAAALLLQGKDGFKALIHPMTLQRIGDDVDRERRGRDWLRDARGAAEERAKIRGLTVNKSTSATLQSPDEARAEVVRLGIEPRLVLRPLGGLRWEVALEIPDFSHLLLRFPQMRDVLTEARCTVAGAAGRPLARGRCLHGPQRVVLDRWPRPDEVLLRFERQEPQLEYLLRGECLLRPGTTWLFRMASDGLAYESRGMRVRAGSKYLLVSTMPFVRSDVARNAELTCQGTHALLLDIPTVITFEWEQALRQLQVAQAKSIEVWPAGLAAVSWDGEGHGEWLASETPTLAIRSDHVIDELTIATGDDDASLSLTLTNTPPGEPIFIELPPLPVGLHKFRVAARSGSGAEPEVIGELDVVMRVRVARPWSPEANTHGPLDVDLDPAAPSLEQLWEGNAAVVVRGPAGRQLKCRVQMFTRAGEVPAFERHLPPVTLPLSSQKWRSHFDSHIKQSKDAPFVYDDAHLCEVEFSADELGVFMLRCEREFKPLRWSLRRDAAGFIVRLHDDAGSGVPTIERHSFERPTIGEKLPQGAEHQAPREGGLYVATLDKFTASIIVPPVVRGSLVELRFEPRVEVTDHTPRAVVRLLRFAQLWASARLPGSALAASRRRSVLRALTAHVASVFCGEAWANAEKQCLNKPQGLMQLSKRIASHQSKGAIGTELARDYQSFASDPPKSIVTGLASLPARLGLVPKRKVMIEQSTVPGGLELRRIQPPHGVGPDDAAWLAEFALRVASDPANLEAWAGDQLDTSIEKLLTEPTLARAARWLVLAVDGKQDPRADFGEIYAGCRWS